MILIQRKKIVFEDETVYITGHAYVECTFRRCTLVVRGMPFAIVGCDFERPCQWDFDFTFNNPLVWKKYLEVLFPVVGGSLVQESDLPGIEIVENPAELMSGTKKKPPVKPKRKPRAKRRGRNTPKQKD